MKCIQYNDGYKYQLKETYTLPVGIQPGRGIITPFILLDIRSNLTLAKGYAWDDPSDPSIGTLTFMRGSLIHDAPHQLVREKKLDHEFMALSRDRGSACLT